MPRYIMNSAPQIRSFWQPFVYGWLASLLLIGISASRLTADEPAPGPANAAQPEEQRVTILLVGDSTVTDAAGWGRGFAACFGPQVTCVNHAAGGRSSKSFRDEGRWQKALQTPADYVLIQFGHNDQPGKGPARETDPETTYRANMQRYVQEARDAGMQPILVTSLTRRTFQPDGKIRCTLGPYVSAVKALAEAENVPVIDLHTLSRTAAEQAGPEKCRDYSPQPEGKTDATHLNAAGSLWIGQIVAQQLTMTLPQLKPLAQQAK